MDSLNAALLVNLLGFLAGISLYTLLAIMVVRHRRASDTSDVNSLLLATAALGTLWNLGELVITIQRDLGNQHTNGYLIAAAYSALGFLPTVVVHSVQNEPGRRRSITLLAYGLSIFAAILHFSSAFRGESVPSALAMQSLTVGAVTLAALLLFLNFRETLEKKAVWASALLVFAVSSLHLSIERSETSWVVELLSHQSSLPIALVILYQNFRFAFADLFLKRAISLLLLTFAAFGLYVLVAAPLLKYHESHDRNDVFAITLILTLWITTALFYPLLHQGAVWFVDRMILRRADYNELQFAITNVIEALETPEAIINEAGRMLAAALTADKFSVDEEHRAAGAETSRLVTSDVAEARVRIPVTDHPGYVIRFGEFRGGRRLLSDETAMLEAVALKAARRIDSVRVVRERYELEFREQEYSKLAAEAQLTVLRSQINPHFLFNALTTIGYLISSSPEKAVETLLHLTRLLRGVLSSTGEFSTLGAEMELIENYLDIERARFEEKLTVTITLPEDLKHVQIPSLLLQPLVENAIKHGISENKAAGELEITAERLDIGNGEVLVLRVRDTGASRRSDRSTKMEGVGLSNIRERLAAYYSGRAQFDLVFESGGWTRAEIRIPINSRSRKAA